MVQPLSAQEDTNRRMLRARDEMDRRYAEQLDVPTLAAIAHLSASQFARAVPGQDTSILLELVTTGALGGVFLISDDVHATFAALRDAYEAFMREHDNTWL